MVRIDGRAQKLKFWLTIGGFYRSSGRIACAILLDAVCAAASLAIDDQPKRLGMAGATEAEGAIADESNTLCAEMQGVCRAHAAPLHSDQWIELHFVE